MTSSEVLQSIMLLDGTVKHSDHRNFLYREVVITKERTYQIRHPSKTSHAPFEPGTAFRFRLETKMFYRASSGQPLKSIVVRDRNLWLSRIKWTADGNALIYMTEKDGTLSITKQSLDGKPPEELAT